MDGTLVPTNAFVLLTNNMFPFAKIQCALFKGTERVVFIDKRDFEGPLYEQIEEAYACVQVAVYDDRVEITSPGMLYGGL